MADFARSRPPASPTGRRLLVVYNAESTQVPTLLEYVDCFRRWSRFEVEYLHGAMGAMADVDFDRYDAILVNHCCLLYYRNFLSFDVARRLKRYRGVKLCTLQDEYRRTDVIREQIAALGFHVVLTGTSPDLVNWVYPPERFPGVRFLPVLTAYLPERLPPADLVRPLDERPIPVGYRGSWGGGWYGDLVYRKLEVGRRFRAACEARGVPCDIEWSDEARIYGDAWYVFIASCRTVLGAESASNVFDFDGSLESLYRTMLRDRGHVDYWNEFRPHLVERERGVNNGMISPRIFEAVALRTPMILVEGHYSGVIAPHEHYIPVRTDFSDVDDVLDRIDDLPALAAMARRAYDHVIGSGAYTYRRFVETVEGAIENVLGREAVRQAADPAVEPPPPDHPLLERATPEPLGPGHVLARQAAFHDRIPPVISADEVPDGAPLHIFGAGGAGRMVRDALMKGGRRVAGFIDSWREGVLDGSPIRRLDDFLALPEAADAVVVVASDHRHEIMTMLMDRDVPRVFDAAPLIHLLLYGERAPTPGSKAGRGA